MKNNTILSNIYIIGVYEVIFQDINLKHWIFSLRNDVQVHKWKALYDYDADFYAFSQASQMRQRFNFYFLNCIIYSKKDKT